MPCDASRDASLPRRTCVALDALAHADPKGLRLVIDYSWGGWLEMVRPEMVRPGVIVFIDGRSEVYGDAQVARYAQILGVAPGWDAAIEATGANAALVRAASELVPALITRGWTVAYRDPVAVLLVRPPG